MVFLDSLWCFGPSLGGCGCLVAAGRLGAPPIGLFGYFCASGADLALSYPSFRASNQALSRPLSVML